jgi:type IV pilus assembly protein PilQ
VIRNWGHIMTRTIGDNLLRGLCTMLAMALVTMAARADTNTLQSVNISQGRNDSQVVNVTLQNPLSAEPVHFATANPHRIVVDFAQTASSQGRISKAVEAGVIGSYDVIQAGARTRLVLDLKGPARYELRQTGNHVLVVVHGEQTTPEAGSAPAHFAEAGAKRDHSIRDVEFKRGKSGEGRVIVSLSDPGVGIDIRQKGESVQVDFLNTALPASLQRRLDVTDFGTPAQTIETVEQARSTHMSVQASGRWDYSAYQTGDQFVLEFRSLEGQSALAAAEQPRYTGEKLTLNFQNVGVREVLQVIADFTGLNIIASDTVTGNLTLRLKDVPWDQALDIILRAKGLDKRTTGNVIWVAPRDELATKERLELEAKQQISDLEELRIETIPLNYLRANEAQAILLGQSVIGQQSAQAVSCDTGGGSIGGTAQVTAGGGQGGQAGAQRILSKRGSVTYDLKSNTLFVQDTPSKLAEIHGLLEKVDVPTKQVMIEARIVVADDGFSRELGARLGYQFGGGVGGVNVGMSGTGTDSASNAANGNVGSDVTYNVNLPTPDASSAIGITLLGASTGKMLNLELQAMEADTRGKIVSNPRVFTQNNVPAVIMQGEQIPYQTVSNNGTQTQFANAVLCLLVNPQVLNNDNIILDVEVRKDAQGVATTAGPAINNKRVRTQVRLKNGETAVLGGIYEDTIRNDTQKVPLLGDIPILGNLFRSNTRQDNKTELLIFLTPKILLEGS